MRNIIIISVALFFLGQGTYLAFNGFYFRPDKVITVRFKEVPPVIKFAGDVSVYYRGYKVGKATCKKLSNDQKYILFCVEINYKNLKLPINTKIVLKTQDLFGDRYFEFIYPDKPDKKMLAHGDIVDGTAVYERIDKYLVEEMENGKLATLISNLNYLTGGARSILGGNKKKLGKVTENVTGSVEDLSFITDELKTMLKNPQFRKTLLEVPAALGTTGGQLAVTNTLLPEVNKNLVGTNKSFALTHKDFDKVNKNLSETNQYLPGINESLDITNPLLCNTTQKLESLDQKIPEIPDSLISQTERTLTQAEKTLMRYDCIGQALSKTVSKNCLFLRFLFGNPGKSFENCTNIGNGYYYCCPQNDTKR